MGEDKVKSYPKNRYLFLFSSFLLGMAKALDLGNVLSISPIARSAIASPWGRISHFSISSNEAPERLDYQAIKSDWEMVGKDLQIAIYEFDKQQNKENRVKI
ncbi:MAG: hypothetical protein K6U11_14445 [bacterium]|nr:hypothetical protein [bacterium]